MRSISAKIIAWSLATCVLALVAFGGISYLRSRIAPGPVDFFERTLAMMEAEACRAYEEGGSAGLAAFLHRLDAYYPAEHLLTDSAGRDLVTSADRSAWLAPGPRPGPPRHLRDGRAIIDHRLRGGQYHLLIVIRPRFDPLAILPYYAGVVAAIALLSYALAVHLASPLRTLRAVVDRFGQGDHSARVRSERKDEIGELSCAFDAMADQIETLRAAELRLLQDISHELRSPLARLAFNVELARMSAHRDLEFSRIQKDLRRLTDLVDELLQLTCAEGDAASRTMQDVSLDDLVRAVADDCLVEASAKACRIDLQTPARVAIVGDRELLRRAVENILRNAIRHAPERSAIEVALARRDNLAWISVRDHGPGVPDESLDAIFDPFFRVDGDRSRSSGGVGLGLSIVRRSIERHHGRVSAHNAAPGLCITIELPFGPDELAVTSPSGVKVTQQGTQSR